MSLIAPKNIVQLHCLFHVSGSSGVQEHVVGVNEAGVVWRGMYGMWEGVRISE